MMELESWRAGELGRSKARSLRRKRLGAVCFALLLPLLVMAEGDAGFMPPEGPAQGWTKDGAPKVYEGEALYDHIDGGGEIFLETGFEACTVQRYRRGGETLAAEIYRMTDPAAALGIYLSSCGRETPDAALSERHTVGRNQLLLLKGRYYLVVTSPEASPGMGKILAALGRGIAEKLPAAEPPTCLNLLPKEGLVPGSLRIVRGPVGLGATVTLGDGDVLLLERKATAVLGDYKEKDGSLVTLLVAEYPSPEAAREALKHLGQKLDRTLTPLSVTDAMVLYRESSGTYGQATTEGAKLTLRFGLKTKPN
jgi:hypothetical protein